MAKMAKINEIVDDHRYSQGNISGNRVKLRSYSKASNIRAKNPILDLLLDDKSNVDQTASNSIYSLKKWDTIGDLSTRKEKNEKDKKNWEGSSDKYPNMSSIEIEDEVQRRVTQEIPRHNWLEKKIRKEKTATLQRNYIPVLPMPQQQNKLDHTVAIASTSNLKQTISIPLDLLSFKNKIKNKINNDASLNRSNEAASVSPMSQLENEAKDLTIIWENDYMELEKKSNSTRNISGDKRNSEIPKNAIQMSNNMVKMKDDLIEVAPITPIPDDKNLIGQSATSIPVNKDLIGQSVTPTQPNKDLIGEPRVVYETESISNDKNVISVKNDRRKNFVGPQADLDLTLRVQDANRIDPKSREIKAVIPNIDCETRVDPKIQTKKTNEIIGKQDLANDDGLDVYKDLEKKCKIYESEIKIYNNMISTYEKMRDDNARKKVWVEQVLMPNAKKRLAPSQTENHQPPEKQLKLIPENDVDSITSLQNKSVDKPVSGQAIHYCPAIIPPVNSYGGYITYHSQQQHFAPNSHLVGRQYPIQSGLNCTQTAQPVQQLSFQPSLQLQQPNSHLVARQYPIQSGINYIQTTQPVQQLGFQPYLQLQQPNSHLVARQYPIQSGINYTQTAQVQQLGFQPYLQLQQQDQRSKQLQLQQLQQQQLQLQQKNVNQFKPQLQYGSIPTSYHFGEYQQQNVYPTASRPQQTEITNRNFATNQNRANEP